MHAALESHMLKFGHPGPKGRQNSCEKVHVFCKGYNEVAFLCNGTERHEILAKMSINMLY